MQIQMPMRIATLQLLVATLLLLGLGGCATKYYPPDNTKVTQSTKKVESDISRAKENHKKQKEVITSAQESADKISVLSTTAMGSIEEIIKIAPPELQPPLALVKSNIEELQTEENILIVKLSNAQSVQDTQGQILTETQTDTEGLKKNQAKYESDSKKLADIATSQSSKLAWYRLHWWGSWIVLGIGALLCIALPILKKFIMP